MSKIVGAKFSLMLTLPHPASIFGITMNGVQPLSLVRNLIHVPDRNILTRICAKNPSDADKYWIAQLNLPDIIFNPFFTAVEGSNKKTPTRDEFIKSYFLAEKQIKKYLPLISVIPHSETTLSKSYALVEDIAHRWRRESEFLIATAPLVTTRYSDNKLLEKEQEILQYAIDHELNGGSLSLLAVLSCLYEDSRGSRAAPGRGVLNPKVAYTAENAYNCLSDLFALELLVASSSFEIGHYAFITADKNLARFWQALDASATEPINGNGTGKFKITKKLFQRIDDNGLARLENLLSE